MSVLNKISKLILIFPLFFSLPAMATPKFTLLGEGQQAPFKGALFNPEAVAELLAGKELMEDEFKLKLGYELEKKDIQFSREEETLRLRIATLESEMEITIQSKDQEIKDLHNLVKSHAPSSGKLWFGAGIVTGILTTTAIVYATK